MEVPLQLQMKMAARENPDPAVVVPHWADPKLQVRVLSDFLEADERICRSMGVGRDIGAAAMAKLWKRTFVTERDRRAGPGANAQRRGQVSRQLKAELEEALRDGND